MQCKNCGATIHEGDTFCRTCAMPVDVDPYTGLEDLSNPATSAFMRQDSQSSIQTEPIYKNDKMETISKPIEPVIDNDANKNYIKRDGNDRTSATFKNVLGLIILLVILLIIGLLMYNNVFSNLF